MRVTTIVDEYYNLKTVLVVGGHKIPMWTVLATSFAIMCMVGGIAVVAATRDTASLSLTDRGDTYPISITFYIDPECTHEIAEASIPAGAENIFYARIYNSGTPQTNLGITASGERGLWANIYSRDETITYFRDGSVVTRLDLDRGEELEVKIRAGVPNTIPEGTEIDLVVLVTGE
jgi:hypothetical protein